MPNHKKLIVFEYGAHYHVIPPILALFKYPHSIIFMDKQFHNFMNDTIKLYKLDSEIKDLRDSRLVLVELFKCSDNSLLVVSTAREFILSKQEFLQLILIALFKPKILCVRNPARWTYKGLKSISKKSGILKIMVSLFTLRLLIKRAKNLIVESEAQKKFMFENFRLSRRANVIPFTGRLIDVIPLNTNKDEFDLNAQLVIGILGSIDTEKRNYAPIIEAVKKVSTQTSIIVVFLGNTHPKASSNILDQFSDVVRTVSPINGSWDEQSFYNLGSRCSFLISPLRRAKGYGELNGSGALADAIFLKKIIFVPDFIFFGSEYDDFVFKYNELDLEAAVKEYLQEPDQFGISLEKYDSKWLESKLI
jgi:hypothetical protein